MILSDHALPDFDGFAALAIARENCPSIPFIFFTGSLGEEKVLDTLRRGATDHVLKHRLSSLSPAVRRALRKKRNTPGGNRPNRRIAKARSNSES